MNRYFGFMNRFVLAFLFCLLVTACGGGKDGNQSTLTPLPYNNIIDPPNSALKTPVENFIKSQNAPLQTQYDIARTDLNGDGRRDAILLFKSPHNYWCGWDGCGMLILKATNESFIPMATISNVRGPIYVANTKTNNWRDIIIRVSGTNFPDKNIVMAFNGVTYPDSPLLGPDLEVPLSSLKTERYFR